MTNLKHKSKDAVDKVKDIVVKTTTRTANEGNDNKGIDTEFLTRGDAAGVSTARKDSIAEKE